MPRMKKETKAARSRRVEQILEALDREYGTELVCYLNHETPWQLLIAVILSAQCLLCQTPRVRSRRGSD